MNRREFLLSAAAGAAGVAVTMPAVANSMGSASRLGVLPPTAERFSFESVRLDAEGRVVALQPGQGLHFTQAIGNGGGVDVDMVVLRGEHLLMGASAQEAGCGPYECTHRSVTTGAMAIGRSPVTQAQWQAVATLPRVARDLIAQPSYVDAASHPVECVSWEDASEFCARLSAHSGLRYRLPSEAEWEAACRAGSSTPFHSGATITSEYANYIGSHTYAGEQPGHYRRSTTPVATFLPNAYGLFDMHGNVWEWCADQWHEDHSGAPADARARLDGADSGVRVVRGGAWSDSPDRLRSASRSGYAATSLNRIIGFRIALTL